MTLRRGSYVMKDQAHPMDNKQTVGEATYRGSAALIRCEIL